MHYERKGKFLICQRENIKLDASEKLLSQLWVALSSESVYGGALVVHGVLGLALKQF